VLRKFGLRAFHCPNCNRYFHRFPANGQSNHADDWADSPFFRKAGSEPELPKLLEQIRQAEKEAGIGARTVQPEVALGPSPSLEPAPNVAFDRVSRFPDPAKLRRVAPVVYASDEDLSQLRQESSTVAKARAS